MYSFSKFSILITLLFLTLGAHAQVEDSLATDAVVITGTKHAIPVEQSGKSIYKLTRQDIQMNAGKSVDDILNEVPGIQVGGNFGIPGTNISYFVRGGGSKTTLVLIDGQPLNDPSGVDAQYDLRLLPVSQIESIEVLRGGLSTLYGTGAAAAVINIKLIEGANLGTSGTIDVHAGSFGTVGGSASIGGSGDKVSYNLFGSVESVEGLSAALDPSGADGFAKDGFNQFNLMGKLGYQVSSAFSIDAIAAYDDMSADFDAGAFADGDNSQTSDQFRVGLTPTYEYGNGSVKLKTVFNTNNREFTGGFPVMYNGTNLQSDLVVDHRLNEDFKVLAGVNLQRLAYEEVGTITKDISNFTIIDPYASVFYGGEKGLNLQAGLRLNTHSNYGSKLLYNLNPSYLIGVGENTSVKVLASISSSNITPSLFQLFAPFFGNEELNPEESINLEFGAALYAGDNVEFNAAYFIRDETNPINFVSEFDDMGNFVGGAYQNTVAERQVSGFEIDGKIKLSNSVNLSLFYAHVTSDVEESLRRIPSDKAGANLQYSPTSQLSTSLKFNYTSSRKVFDFVSFSELELESYSLIDLYAQYKMLDDKLTVYGAVNNVFGTDFVGIYGFTTIGRNVSFGLRYSF